ncbi:transglutaminase family protein [Halosimplex halophilum]|uniref:transglutaminase family protein n=1 Tax=Halosimplex halophilum TaxID=2559572 RepID=UPI00107F2875|nr:transglutaminase domain-containing protein [Halosimplex halophilum]
MSDADERFEFGEAAPTREYGVVALAAACVVAAVLATALIPAAASVGLGDAPAESLIPLPPGAAERAGEEGNGAAGASASGFGALNVGDSTSVGGPVGERGESPFRSQDTEVHFRVRSQESNYWRTGAYDTYTGSGWSRSGPSDATAPVEGEETRYRVELVQSASAAPTVWRPTDLERAEGVSLTEGGLARADDRLSAGTSYVGVSRTPPRDPELLRATGRDYPDAVERRYTRLPPSTAVSLRPFTNNVTEGAENPYETATRVERWLETNKEYSLNVSRPSGDNVAREFVTQMDAGYCEYFATAMVTMLRSQEIPARYVVGYSTGRQVGANTFQVRAMNAHAWVEVYFADVGWVRFDPTPGAERLRAEQAAYEDSDAPGRYAPQEEGSPGETFSAEPGANGTEQETGTTTDPGTQAGPDATPPTPVTPSGPDEPPSDDPDEPTGGYDVSLNRTAVPGTTVAVTVEAGAQPVAGATVAFNGEPIGQTGRDGTVAGRVPFAENLTVTVSGGTTTGTGSGTGGAAALEEPAAPSASASEWFDDRTAAAVAREGSDDASGQGAEGSGPESAGASESSPRRQAENTSRSFDVATNATLSVSGDARTNATVLVTATVDGVAVPDAAVTLDGERVARTDADGRATVALSDSPGNVTLRVARDPVAGERTLELGRLRVEAESLWPLPVAGTPVDVTARLGNESVAGAPVRLGGDRVGTTGVDGTLAATLPFASSASVAVDASGQTARTAVANPLVNAAGVALAAVALVAAAAVGVARRSVDPRAVPRRVAATLRTLARGTVRAFVGGAVAVAARIRATLAQLRGLVAGERSPAELLTALGAWLADWSRRLRPGAPAAEGNGASAASAADRGGDAAGDDAHLTIREAWGRFLGHVSVRRPWTKTPGQLADHAVTADGLPPGAVATLRDEFRAVEYGPRSPDESVPAVEGAIERIESALDGDHDEASADHGGSGTGHDRRSDGTGDGGPGGD